MATKERTKKAAKPTPEEKLCGELIELMEKGKNPWRKEWESKNDGRHQNLITGNFYHGGNVALLEMYAMCRNYDEALWLGANQGIKAGLRCMHRGSDVLKSLNYRGANPSNIFGNVRGGT